MTTSICFPEVLKPTIKRIADQRGYPAVAEVINRGGADELIVNSQEEAQALVNVARIEMLSASLKYPFWDEDSLKYDKCHDESFQDVQMGLFEKTIMYISQSFDIVPTV